MVYAYAIGDNVEVLVVTKRGKQPEWVPAVVTVEASDRIEVMFIGGSRQKFPPDTDRLRPANAAEEGDTWEFSTF